MKKVTYTFKNCKRCKKSYEVRVGKRHSYFCSIKCRNKYYQELLSSFNIGKVRIRRDINAESKKAYNKDRKICKVVKYGHKTE